MYFFLPGSSEGASVMFSLGFVLHSSPAKESAPDANYRVTRMGDCFLWAVVSLQNNPKILGYYFPT
jgi:hypothetical protein